MYRELQMVRAFHEKHGFAVHQAIGANPKNDLVRVHLINEELAELALALGEKDFTKAADALGDLAYVVIGAAVTYGIPLKEVFDEIHRSNMTKAVRRPDDTRLRDKGDSYVPPSIGIACTRGFGQIDTPRPKVVCLCGSTRFLDEFQKAEFRLTIEGCIVLTVGCDTKSDSELFKGVAGEVIKQHLDELHKRKIDISDEVFVINKGGYIGSSTRSEIEYATARCIPVKYMEDVA